jgi:hypothetical protein
MNTVLYIDEPDAKTATHRGWTRRQRRKKPPCPLCSSDSPLFNLNQSKQESSNLFSTRILSASLYATTVAVALLGTGAAMASEATQFVDAPGTMSRASVQAELSRARANGELVSSYEADQRVSQPAVAAAAAVVRERAEVRAEARAAARNHKLNELYLGA